MNTSFLLASICCTFSSSRGTNSIISFFEIRLNHSASTCSEIFLPITRWWIRARATTMSVLILSKKSGRSALLKPVDGDGLATSITSGSIFLLCDSYNVQMLRLSSSTAITCIPFSANMPEKYPLLAPRSSAEATSCSSISFLNIFSFAWR